VANFKRKKTKADADAILSADWHIRPDTPIGRTDEYLVRQAIKVHFIFDLAKQNNCPIFVAGDLGNKAQWPNWLLEWFIGISKGVEILLVPGQHDLPNHRLELLPRSGTGVLGADNTVQILIEGQHEYLQDTKVHGFPYGCALKRIKREHRRHVAMIHQMIIENKPLWPGQVAPKGHWTLKTFPDYDLILSGDNHNAFHIEHEGRWLVNPGSMMRMTAAQEDHRPRVYLWWAKTNKIKPVYLPIKPNVISRKHIEIVEDRNERMTALVIRVREDVEIGLSYQNNLENYFQKYRTRKRTKEKAWMAYEGDIS